MGYELPVYRAYGWLVAAGRARRPDRRRTALRAAVDAASQDGQPWLNALAWAALGLACPSESAEAFEHAARAAERVQFPAFRKGIADVARGHIPEAWAGLRALVPEDAAPAIVLSLAAREIRVGSRTISLSPREAELLLALALHPTPRDSATLAAMIWPDVLERNASHVRVYVSRLRRRFGDLDIIEARGSGYVVRAGVKVDLLMLEDAIRARRTTQRFDPDLEAIIASQHVRLPQWVAGSEWLAPYARRYEDAVRVIREARATDAEERHDRELTTHYRRLLVAEDDSDGTVTGL
jgi:DNA-binding winged helix-turn-helix (wHTH) protein